jgi:AraC-like DNA-binding protein
VLSAETRANLGSLALAAGYADQPHMTREVRELAGETPLSLLRRQWAPSAMSDFFKTVTGAHA